MLRDNEGCLIALKFKRQAEDAAGCQFDQYVDHAANTPVAVNKHSTKLERTTWVVCLSEALQLACPLLVIYQQEGMQSMKPLKDNRHHAKQ
jgi:hypothetical protein